MSSLAGSSSPGSYIVHITNYLVYLTWCAGDWTWELVHSKRMHHHWMTFLSIKIHIWILKPKQMLNYMLFCGTLKGNGNFKLGLMYDHYNNLTSHRINLIANYVLLFLKLNVFACTVRKDNIKHLKPIFKTCFAGICRIQQSLFCRDEAVQSGNNCLSQNIIMRLI